MSHPTRSITTRSLCAPYMSKTPLDAKGSKHMHTHSQQVIDTQFPLWLITYRRASPHKLMIKQHTPRLPSHHKNNLRARFSHKTAINSVITVRMGKGTDSGSPLPMQPVCLSCHGLARVPPDMSSTDWIGRIESRSTHLECRLPSARD